MNRLILQASAVAVLSGTMASADIKVGVIAPMVTDDGLSTLRGAELAIEELNAAGGVLGQQVVLVSVDTELDPEIGKAAYDRLVLEEEVDLIISGSYDDTSLAWMPSVKKYQVPTIDTWATSISIIDMIVEDYDSMKSYFMNAAADEALVTQYIEFGKEVLAEEMNWSSVYVLAEESAFGGAMTGLITEALGPYAGIEVLGARSFPVETTDYAPLFDEAVESGADFIYMISTIDSQNVASQYAKLQVPMPLTGVLVASTGVDFWADTGGLGGGTSTFVPAPGVAFMGEELSRKFVDTYLAKYDTRPTLPLFAGYHAYFGVKQAMAAAEEAGGFELDAWVPAMESQDLKLTVDGEVVMRYAYWGRDEVEPVTGRTFPHNLRFDLAGTGDAGPAMVVFQWYEDGTTGVIYPERFRTGDLVLPTWIVD